jgi:hypothetical protein
MMSMPVDLSAFDYYLFAALAVVGSFVGAWLLIWLSRSSRFSSLIDSFRGVAPNFRVRSKVMRSPRDTAGFDQRP